MDGTLMCCAVPVALGAAGTVGWHVVKRGLGPDPDPQADQADVVRGFMSMIAYAGTWLGAAAIGVAHWHALISPVA